MSQPNPDVTPPRPVTIVVESEDNKKFHIATADLETISSQIRGKRGFSVFNSVIMPIGITILTAFATTLIAQGFQYVSWRNSTSTQEAHDLAIRGAAAYDKAAAAFAERYYATFVFLSAARDLANRKADIDSHLYRLDLALNKLRFERYYDQLRSWNEKNGQILGEIDVNLDRPVLINELMRSVDLNKIDCRFSLTEQMLDNKLRVHSLKLQFGIIRRCFAEVLSEFTPAKDAAVVDREDSISPAIASKAGVALDNVRTMSNEFRCHAVSRIAFLRLRESFAIYFPQWMGLIRKTPQQREADARNAHFKQTLKDCKFY